MPYTPAIGDDQLPIVRALPQGSQAADRLLDTIDYNQKVGAYNQQQKLKQAQDMAQSYKDNAFKAKNGTLFNPELTALQQKHLQQGMEYAKQGIDIYSPNPNNASQLAAHEQYMGDRQKLYNYQDVRDEVAKHLIDQDKKYSEAKPGMYDTDSLNAIHDFYTKNTLRDIADKGLQAPYLQESFNKADFMDKIKPATAQTKLLHGNQEIDQTIPDMPKIRTNVLSNTLNNPAAAKQFRKDTGIDPADLIPQNRPESIRKYYDDYYRSVPANGMPQSELSQYGIQSYNDPKYEQFLSTKVQQQLKAQHVLNEDVRAVASRADSKYAKSYNFDLENQGTKRADEAWKRKDHAHTQADWATKDNEEAFPSYNVAGNVAKPGKPGTTGTPETLTSPLELDAGDIKGAVIPKEVYNTTTGHKGVNTDARNISAAKIRLMPVDPKTGTLLSDKDLKSRKVNPDYKYMVYGAEKTKQPVMEKKDDGTTVQATNKDGSPSYKEQTHSVAFDYDNLTDDKFSKKIDFDKVEKNLAPEIQFKLLYQKINKLHPDLPEAQKRQFVTEYYNNRLQQNK